MQKYRLKLQKAVPQSHMLGYKDKDGTSLGHVHSRYEMEEYPPETLFDLLLHVEANPCTLRGQPSVEDFPPLPDDFFDGLPNFDTGGIFGDPNQLDILSQQQQAPTANNTLGFNLPLPVEASSFTIEGSTICGNQSNSSMTQMAQAPSSEQIWNELKGGQHFFYQSFLNDIDVSTNDIHVLDEFPNLDTLQGGISGDPGFFNNAPVLSSSEDFGINYIPFCTNNEDSSLSQTINETTLTNIGQVNNTHCN